MSNEMPASLADLGDDLRPRPEDDEHTKMRKWAANWIRLGPILEKIRREELKQTDTVKSMQVLSGWFDNAIHPTPLRPSSGLIEQQFYFQKGWKR
jgi:hypothetical protein